MCIRDRCKAEVASAVNNLPGRIVDIADDTRPAAHVRALRLRSARDIILLVKRRVQKREIREQPLRGYLAGELEPVSYTHLDVYKRQDLRSSHAPPDCEMPFLQ